MVQVKWVDLGESEITWELVANIHQDVPAYMVSLLRKLKPTKAIRSPLQQQYGKKIYSKHCVDGGGLSRSLPRIVPFTRLF